MKVLLINDSPRKSGNTFGWYVNPNSLGKSLKRNNRRRI